METMSTLDDQRNINPICPDDRQSTATHIVPNSYEITIRVNSLSRVFQFARSDAIQGSATSIVMQRASSLNGLRKLHPAPRS